MAKVVLIVIVIEQHHKELSFYRYPELKSDGGLWSSPVKYCGLVWTEARPSDDQGKYGYHVPSNFMVGKLAQQLQEIFTTVYNEKKLEEISCMLFKEIDEAIKVHAVKEVNGKKIYAYEVDGMGNSNFMDDANMPSLLSLPLQGYKPSFDRNGEIYKNTKQFVLSKANKFYFEGKMAKGIGSEHTPSNRIWHLSLAAQGLTSEDEEEVESLVKVFEETHAGTWLMHEGFDSNIPSAYSRRDFAWANSMFSQFVLKHLNYLSKKKKK